MRWDALLPVEGGRHCEVCRQTVVDVEAMSSAEVDALVASGERACVRVATLPDGSIMTRDHPRGQRRVVAWAGAAIAASAFACSDGVVESEVAACGGAEGTEAPRFTGGNAEVNTIGENHFATPIARIGRASVVDEVGGLEPQARAGFEMPPEMPALELTRSLAESSGTSETATILLGSIGEAESVVVETFLPPFEAKLD